MGQAVHSCTCAAFAPQAPVWGNGPYTADSDLCTAARHAGVIGISGGEVTAWAAPGQPAYSGTVQHGVETREWGVYEQSFSLVPPGIEAEITPIPSPDPAPVIAVADDSTCPRRLAEGQAGLTCTCAPGRPQGLVWGSGPYTVESDICAAASHAGVTAGAGGPVSVTRGGPVKAFDGSDRNGIASLKWAAAQESLIVMTPGATAATEPEPSIPEGLELVTGGASGVLCGAFPGGALTFDCNCADTPTNGPVFGSGPYAVDSDLCGAARHAGVIGDKGGRLRVLSLTGLQDYRASDRNGVSSRDRHGAERSITFDMNQP